MQKSSKPRVTALAMAQTAVCAALLCVSAYIAVPLPIGVPFTLQVLTVILVALVLKPLRAVAAQLLYTLLGVVGLPVFSGGRSGPGAILSPTGGFILGFILASAAVSLLRGSAEGRRGLIRSLIVSVFVGIPCIYIPGIAVYMIFANTDLPTAAATLASVFVWIDIVKCILAAFIAVPLRKALNKNQTLIFP